MSAIPPWVGVSCQHAFSAKKASEVPDASRASVVLDSDVARIAGLEASVAIRATMDRTSLVWPASSKSSEIDAPIVLIVWWRDARGLEGVSRSRRSMNVNIFEVIKAGLVLTWPGWRDCRIRLQFRYSETPSGRGTPAFQ